MRAAPQKTPARCHIRRRHKHNKFECGKISARGTWMLHIVQLKITHAEPDLEMVRVAASFSSSRDTAGWRGCSVNVIMPTNIKSSCLSYSLICRQQEDAARSLSCRQSMQLLFYGGLGCWRFLFGPADIANRNTHDCALLAPLAAHGTEIDQSRAKIIMQAFILNCPSDTHQKLTVNGLIFIEKF